jgi:hypothetical protein
MRQDALERQEQVALFFERNPSASARKASREFGVSTPTVLKHMRALGIPVQAKPRRTREQMDAQAREAAALMAEGKLPTEIAKEQGHSRPTVHRDLARLGIRVGRATKYPPPKPRRCLTCGEKFTPTRDAAGRGYGLYCSALCRDRAPERIDKLRASRRRAREEREAYCKRHKLWTIEQAAEWLGRDIGIVCYCIDRGRLPLAEVFKGRVKLVRPGDVKRLGKELAARSDPVFDDPVQFDDWLRETLGLTKQRSREILDRRARAKARIARSRPRAGRPKSSGPPVHHFEWERRFSEVKADLDEQHAAYHVQGDRAPTNHEAAYQVAEEDFAEHPERWDYDPAVRPEKAKRRVWWAVKPLIQAGSEIRAA